MLIDLSNVSLNSTSQRRAINGRIPQYSNTNPYLINTFDNVRLGSNIFQKAKAAIKKVGDKIGDTKVMQAVKNTKVVKTIQKDIKNMPKPLKVAVGILAAPLAPTMTAAALTTGATVATTGITTAAAALPMVPIVKAIQKAKAKKAAKAAQDEQDFQNQMQAIQAGQIDASGNPIVSTDTIPVSARTDAGNVAAVQQAQYATGSTVTPAQTSDGSVTAAPDATAKPAENNLLKYGLPIGLAALALLSNSGS